MQGMSDRIPLAWKRQDSVQIELDSVWTNEEILKAERFASRVLPRLGCGRENDDWATAFVSTGILPGLQVLRNSKRGCSASIVKSKRQLAGFHVVFSQEELTGEVGQ